MLYEQRFPRYGQIFKIAIFGHETWPLAKVPEVAHIPSYYAMGSKFSLFSLYGQRFPIRADFQNCHTVVPLLILGQNNFPSEKLRLMFSCTTPKNPELKMGPAYQGKHQPKFDRNPCNRFRDNRCHRRTDDGRQTTNDVRRTKTPYHGFADIV